MSVSVTVRPGDSYVSPTSMSSKNRRGSLMEALRILLDGADGEASDEAVEEEVVDDGDGDARDESGGPERDPVVDVGVHDGHGHAHVHVYLSHRRDACQAGEALLGQQ